MKLAQSELQVWQRCRRKWWLGYYRGLQPAVPKHTGTSAIGDRVHFALANYYGEGADPVLVVQREAANDAAAFPKEAEAILKDAELAATMVEGYVEWVAETGADSDLEVLAAEDEVEVVLPTFREVSLVGKLDLRVYRRSDNARKFLDHKTVQGLDELPKTARIATQFLHYSLLERLTSPQNETSWCDGGVYNMLKRSKRTARATPPFYGRYEVRHNDEELRNYYRRVVALAREILDARARLDRGEDPRIVCPPTPMPHDCSWSCPFLAVCPMFDSGEDAESVLAVAYREGNPYARYSSLQEGGE